MSIAPDGDRREESQVTTLGVSDETMNAAGEALSKFQGALNAHRADVSNADAYGEALRTGAVALQNIAGLIQQIAVARHPDAATDAPAARHAVATKFVDSVLPNILKGASLDTALAPLLQLGVV